jgi:uncharacterized membrane protein
MRTETKKETMGRLKKVGPIAMIIGIIYIILGMGLFSAVTFSLGAILIVVGLLMILRYEQLRELFFIEEKLNDIVRLYGKKGKR